MSRAKGSVMFYKKSSKRKYATKPNTINNGDRVASIALSPKVWDKLNAMTVETGASRNALISMAVCDFLLNDNAYIRTVFQDKNAQSFLKQSFLEYVEETD